MWLIRYTSISLIHIQFCCQNLTATGELTSSNENSGHIISLAGHLPLPMQYFSQFKWNLHLMSPKFYRGLVKEPLITVIYTKRPFVITLSAVLGSGFVPAWVQYTQNIKDTFLSINKDRKVHKSEISSYNKNVFRQNRY